MQNQEPPRKWERLIRWVKQCFEGITSLFTSPMDSRLPQANLPRIPPSPPPTTAPEDDQNVTTSKSEEESDSHLAMKP